MDLPAWLEWYSNTRNPLPLTQPNAAVAGLPAVIFLEEGLPESMFSVYLSNGEHIFRLWYTLSCHEAGLEAFRRMLDSVRFSTEAAIPADIPESIWKEALRIVETTSNSGPLDLECPTHSHDLYRKDSSFSERAGTSVFELIGQIGCDSSAIALVGDYAFWGVGPRIYILDISLPQLPKFISSSPVAGRGAVIAIRVIGTNVYAITGEADFLVFTYDEQYKFTAIASIELPEKVFDFILNWNFAYLAAGKAGILVLDIQNLIDPSILQFINTRGEARAVAVSGGYLYVAEAVQYSGVTGGMLEVFDLSEQAAPHKVGSADVESPSLAITVQEDYAYLACGGVCLVNVSNPHQPNPMGRFVDYSLYNDMVVVGEYAFVSANLYCDITSCPKQLARIDIQDPQN